MDRVDTSAEWCECLFTGCEFSSFHIRLDKGILDRGGNRARQGEVCEARHTRWRWVVNTRSSPKPRNGHDLTRLTSQCGSNGLRLWGSEVSLSRVDIQRFGMSGSDQSSGHSVVPEKSRRAKKARKAFRSDQLLEELPVTPTKVNVAI
ncbi:unnamed protein product [Mesocestoides corti]|uniref:Uncharacterized protein n=1 Tax=Mesocestoides corti TaxID=53468 RepID=A0A0R3UK17_MESCO|nr:unnamed protein product [Mesocestoides corti]